MTVVEETGVATGMVGMAVVGILAAATASEATEEAKGVVVTEVAPVVAKEATGRVATGAGAMVVVREVVRMVVGRYKRHTQSNRVQHRHHSKSRGWPHLERMCRMPHSQRQIPRGRYTWAMAAMVAVGSKAAVPTVT